MTIGSIVLIVIVAVLGLLIGGFLIVASVSDREPAAAAFGVLALLIAAAICFGIGWWQLNTESGKRALKDQQSNLSGGIERTVTVYDINGNVIKEYSGKFDMETDRESYILFDDEDGNRHMIYYTTGTIIVDEK